MPSNKELRRLNQIERKQFWNDELLVALGEDNKDWTDSDSKLVLHALNNISLEYRSELQTKWGHEVGTLYFPGVRGGADVASQLLKMDQVRFSNVAPKEILSNYSIKVEPGESEFVGGIQYILLAGDEQIFKAGGYFRENSWITTIQGVKGQSGPIGLYKQEMDEYPGATLVKQFCVDSRSLHTLINSEPVQDEILTGYSTNSDPYKKVAEELGVERTLELGRYRVSRESIDVKSMLEIK